MESMRRQAAWNMAPKAWKAENPKPRKPRVFCASLADVFEDWTGPMVDAKGETLLYNEVTGRWWEGLLGIVLRMHHVRNRLFELIDATPNLDWLLLTKRPENIARMMPHISIRPNVWLGVTGETQKDADERIPELLKIPAKVRFVSCEPLLGPVELVKRYESGASWNWLTGQFSGIPMKGIIGNPDCMVATCDPDLAKIHWVIGGGESGSAARPMQLEWIRSLRDQCAAAGVPFHLKQWGEFVPADGMIQLSRPGVKAAGNVLDGVQHLEFPAC